MTFFEFIIPVIAFAVAGEGIWLVRKEARNLERPHHHGTPAE